MRRLLKSGGEDQWGVVGSERPFRVNISKVVSQVVSGESGEEHLKRRRLQVPAVAAQPCILMNRLGGVR